MPQRNPTASIAMCTYNGERFLREQLESFVAQSVLPDELVVCDDGSRDATLDILEDFCRRAPFPVRIYRNETNLGFVKNFEKAATLCEKDVVFLSDQDDMWKPLKIEKTLEVMRTDPEVGLVLLTAENIDENGIICGPARRYHWETADAPTEEMTVWKYTRAPYWEGCNMAYRRSFANVIFPIADPYGHDIWIFCILWAISRTCILRQPTDLRRFHGENTSRRPGTLEKLRKSKSLRAAMRQYYARHMDPARFLPKFCLYNRVLARLHHFSECVHSPEIPHLYERYRQHLSSRAKAVTHGLRRPGIILREIQNGNYSLCTPGAGHIFGDLLAWPFHGKHGADVDRRFAEEALRGRAEQ